MGICSSQSTNTKHKPNINGGYSSAPQSNINKNNNPQNFQSMNSNQYEEAYYKEVGVSNDLGGDFGPREKIQLNVGIRNGQMNYSYFVHMSVGTDQNIKNSVQVGQTKEEMLTSPDGTLNFSISFLMDYFFEKQQYLFVTLRKSGSQTDLATSLGRIMGSRAQTLLLPITEGSMEQIVLSANAVKNNNIMVGLSFAVSQMGNTTNMFYMIKKLKSNVQPDVSNPNGNNVYNTNDFWKIQKSELKPVGSNAVPFNPNRIPAMFLCNGDYEHPIAIEFHSPQERVVLGVHHTTVTRLLSERNFTVGSLNVTCNSELVKEHTFIDFLRGGTQLSLTIGIDFTGSNGNPRDRDSLHGINDQGKPNQYQLAIRTCGDILAYYDYDQTFPVYGYGAVLPNAHLANHCFPLNLSQDANI